MKFEIEESATPITKDDGPLRLTLTPIQKKVFEDPHQFIVFAKGRRCGGTYGAVTYVIEQLIEGKSILWVDTIQANLSAYFVKYFTPLCSQIKNQFWSWNEQKKILKILKGTLTMRSAEIPENIEGFAYDIIIINEAGIVFKNNATLWFNTLYPMTMDYNAKIFFIGTPKGKLCKDGSEHLYYSFYKKCLDQVANPEWQMYQVSTYENPLLDRTSIKKVEDDVPPIIRRQEIYAEFIDEGMDELFKASWWQYSDIKPAEFTIRRRILSLDTAFKDTESADYSAWTMWIQTQDKFYCLDAGMEHLNFPDLITKTQELYDLWKPDLVLIEDKASGQSLIQMFQRTSMPVVAYKIDRDKVSRAVAVTPLIEQGKVMLMRGPWNKVLVDQCSLFPAGSNDDLVDSLTQGLLYLSQGMGTFDNSVRPVISKTILKDKVQQESQAFEVSAPYGPRGNRERVLTNFW